MQFGEWYSNFMLELFRVGRKLVLVTIHREHNGMSALHEGGRADSHYHYTGGASAKSMTGS